MELNFVGFILSKPKKKKKPKAYIDKHTLEGLKIHFNISCFDENI